MRKYISLPFHSMIDESSDGSTVEIGESDFLGALFSKRGRQETLGNLVAFSIRVDEVSAYFLNFAATRSGVSKNELINQVLRAGMEAGWGKMTESERNAFMEDYKNFKFEEGN